METERISVEKYAASHRISIFQVIQKINRGELLSEVEVQDGKKTTWITGEKSGKASEKSGATEQAEEIDYKAAYEKLLKEMEALKKPE